MNTTFMNFKNKKTSDCLRLLINFADKINLKKSDKYVTVSNLSMEKYLKVIQKQQISAPTWNEKTELPDGSYSVSDIQDFFKYIMKKQ